MSNQHTSSAVVDPVTVEIIRNGLYAVTEEGISVIELGAAPSVSGVVPVTTGFLAERSQADVSFAPDGSYAVVRATAATKVATLSLPDGARDEVDLGGVVTDLDLTPDGSRAFAVIGATARVVEVPIPLAGRAPESFRSSPLPPSGPGTQVGLVSRGDSMFLATVMCGYRA